MRKTVSGALSVLKMFKTALHGEKVVHIYWHTSAFSLRLRLSHAMHAITSIVQTEASRRRREAEVQQAMENGLGSCMYICMFFTYISQFTAHTEFKSVPFASPLNATLLRNEFSWVRYPKSAWHVKIAKKSTKIPEWRKIMWKLAAEHSSSEDINSAIKLEL